jgi:hypothetical protein
MRILLSLWWCVFLACLLYDKRFIGEACNIGASQWEVPTQKKWKSVINVGQLSFLNDATKNKLCNWPQKEICRGQTSILRCYINNVKGPVHVTKVLQECSENVLRMLQECNKNVLGMLRELFKNVTRMLRERFRNVTRMFHKY